MVKGIVTSGEAMRPAVLAQSVIANNLANATAAGFQQDRIAFQTALSQATPGRGASAPVAAPSLRTQLDTRPGAYEVTERPLDLAVQGSGYFVVQTAEGERYTRAGNFRRTEDGTLVTGRGEPVMGEGGPVRLAAEENLRVTPEGQIRAGEETLGRLRLVTFAEGTTLTHAGAGLLAADGEATAATEAHVLQGVLEGPNTAPMQALVEMITLLRHFEMNQKAFQAQDESLGALLAWVRA